MEPSPSVDVDALPEGDHRGGSHAQARHPFDRLRVRWLVGACLVALVGTQLALNAAGGGAPHDASTLLALLFSQVLVVFLLARFARLDWKRVFGARPTRDEIPLVASAVPVNIVVIAMLISAGSYLIYLPLSLVAPRFVQGWLLSTPVEFITNTPAQLAQLVVLGVLVAPLLEEVLFRGILLQRWAHRWGTVTGVVLSSALFALGHTDWVGHFVTGVLFAALYLRTRSLWVPIATHALNNLIAIVPSGLYELRHPSPPETTTLAELREQIPSSVLKLALGLVLLAVYVRLYWPGIALRAALTGPLPYDENAAVESPAR